MTFRLSRVALAWLILFAPVPASYAQSGCVATPEIYPGTTLSRLASFYYGDVGYQYAILLATNARAGAGFQFIGDPFNLPQPKTPTDPRIKLCVPELLEAERLRNRYDTYLAALADMTVSVPTHVSHSLDPITLHRPVTVATWIRGDQVGYFRNDDGSWVDRLGGDTWVTVEPHLQELCVGFTEANGPDPDLLTFRVEQRLGLAPHSAKTTFVSFTIADPDPAKNVFRPCASPAIDTNFCAVRTSDDDQCPTASPMKERCEAHNRFFYKQYYNSYGAAHPTGFPWTSHGYTFDWALGPADANGRAEFVRFGESEYVVPAGTPITVEGAVTTTEYCTAK